jgi:hypothetical protein
MELGVIFLTTHFYEKTLTEMACILRNRVSHSLSGSDRSEQAETDPQVPITEKEPSQGSFSLELSLTSSL